VCKANWISSSYSYRRTKDKNAKAARASASVTPIVDLGPHLINMNKTDRIIYGDIICPISAYLGFRKTNLRDQEARPQYDHDGHNGVNVFLY